MNKEEIMELLEYTINKCDTCDGDPDFDCVDCTQGGKAELARQILKLLQEDSQ